MNKLILALTIGTLVSCGADNKENKFLPKSNKSENKEVFNNKEYKNDTLRPQDVDDLKEVNIADLEEVNNHFTFRSLPINPKLLYQFLPWVSDSRPTIMSIDLLSANHGTNQFGDVDTLKKNNSGYLNAKFEDGNIGYSWLGVLKNNVHVISFYESTGGSATFYDLLFVKFEIKEYTYNGVLYKQLLMNCVRQNGLGDRAKTDIKLDKQNNKVYVSNQQFQEKGLEKFVVEF